MKPQAFIIALFLLALTFSFAQAQEGRFAFELSGGPAWAVSQQGVSDLNVGAGFEGILHYRFMPHTGLYAGWGWNRFAAENSFAGDNADFEETGYVFGLQFKHPIGTSPLAYYLRAGGLYNHYEIENEAGEIMIDTGHGLGWQLAAGVDIALNESWHLTPGIKFNALERAYTNASVNSTLRINYLTARIGILKRF
jgi:opacity protein-like surface antigen